MKKSGRCQAQPDFFGTAETVPHSTPARGFAGTANPRHLRALHALLLRPRTREEIDEIAGCSNGPALIAVLRRLGLKIPCTPFEMEDRDGRTCHPGVYHLSAFDRRKLVRWMALREGL